MGFISNPDEEARFQSEQHQSRVAEALARAIGRYREGVARLDIHETRP